MRILEEEKRRQLHMFIILWKNLKELASSSINQSVRTPENIAAVAESVCEAPSTAIHRHSERILHKDGMTVVWRQVQLVQELKPWIDHPMRFRFAKVFSIIIQKDCTFK